MEGGGSSFLGSHLCLSLRDKGIGKWCGWLLMGQDSLSISSGILCNIGVLSIEGSLTACITKTNNYKIKSGKKLEITRNRVRVGRGE